ncbi:TVP38/TMEM64 family protein [Alkalibaculum bacchi]|uniref:TVP38/TMEM64 family protein n=1 Tax=Alkalibaculum bacchi TaxID=645887 RepID=UPI0026F15939|nr:VTT domain-containing protein [Alkalibaculum bacchi]
MERKTTQSLLRFIKILPIALIIIGIVVGFQFKDISVADIVKYTPENPFLAACILIGLYALKSISIVFPLIVLNISAGMLFSPLWAIMVNIIGSFVTSVIPYFIGKFVGRGFVMKIMRKHKKFDDVTKMSIVQNPWFYSYFLRVVSVLPGDLVSMLLGSFKLKFTPYILGSLLGIFPGMLAATFMGTAISNPSSPEFIIALVGTVLLSVVSYFVYRRWKNKTM